MAHALEKQHGEAGFVNGEEENARGDAKEQPSGALEARGAHDLDKGVADEVCVSSENCSGEMDKTGVNGAAMGGLGRGVGKGDSTDGVEEDTKKKEEPDARGESVEDKPRSGGGGEGSLGLNHAVRFRGERPEEGVCSHARLGDGEGGDSEMAGGGGGGQSLEQGISSGVPVGKNGRKVES